MASDSQLVDYINPAADASCLDDPSLASESLAAQEPRQSPLVLTRTATSPPLFDYQRELARGFVDLAMKGMRGLISLPTGGGKTLTAAYGLVRFLEKQPNAKVLWFAPTRELLDQAYDTVWRVWQQTGSAPDLTLSFEETALSPGVTFLTPQSKPWRSYQLVVFDEAHHLAAPFFASVVEKARSEDQAAVIGLSATPGRSITDEVADLLRIFDRRLVTSPSLGNQPVKNLQRRGILSVLEFKSLSKKRPDQLRDHDKLGICVRAASQFARTERKVLLFTTSVQYARVIAALLRHNSVPALHVEGNMPDDERRARLAKFAQGSVHVLTNQKLLTAGYDFPGVTDVIIQGKVGSPIQFEQIVGRVARGPRTGGTTIGRVWQFDDHLALHGLPESYHRYQDEGWEKYTIPKAD